MSARAGWDEALIEAGRAGARAGRSGGSLTMLLIVVGVLVVCLVIVQVDKQRKRRDPDRGGLGYSPADLRPAPAAQIQRGRQDPAADPYDTWLLGLAAPFVELSGLVHQAWSLQPERPDEAWRRKIAETLDAHRVASAQRWQEALEWAESQTSTDGLQEWAVAQHAFLCRLGVAAGHLSPDEARRKVAAVAAPLLEQHRDWFGFADAFLDACAVLQEADLPRMRAAVRVLYAPGGPWAQPAWPS